MRFAPLLLGVTALFAGTLKGQNNIIVYYTPVQTNVIGKSLTSYRNGQALFGNQIPNVTTADEFSSASDVEEYKKRFSLGIAKILVGSSANVTNIEAYNVKVTNLTNQVELLPDGPQIVMSALKADSVIISIKKTNDYQLSLSDLLGKIKAFAAVSSASALNLVSLIDSVGYSNSKTVKVVIKNPSVYYAIIVGQKIKNFTDEAYFDMLDYLGGNITLNSQNFVTKKPTRVRMSKTYLKIGFPVDLYLRYRTDSLGKPQLFVSATKAEGGTNDILVPKQDDTHWFGPNLFVAQPSVPGKITKKYSMDITAHLTDDGKSIVLEQALVHYPEWELMAITEKHLTQ